MNPANQTTTMVIAAPTHAPLRRFLVSEDAQQRCHIASEKTVAAKRARGMVRMEEYPEIGQVPEGAPIASNDEQSGVPETHAAYPSKLGGHGRAL